MTPREINELKKQHNALLEQGQAAYAELMRLYGEVTRLQKIIEGEEGPDYDPIPLIFGDGFWIDPDL